MEEEETLNPKFIKDDDISSEKYLWKYMDLHKFLSFVLTKSLYLTRLDKFEDKREGINIEHLIYRSLKRKLDNSPQFEHLKQIMTVDNLGSKMNLIEDDLKIIQRFNFANCWVLCDKNKESVAMWNLYSNPNSIAIRIKYSDFKEKFIKEKIINHGFSDEIICRPVEYVDFNDDRKIAELLNEKTLDTIFMKDYSFSHEKEFRIVLKEKVREIPSLNYKKNVSRKLIENLHNETYNYSVCKIELEHFENYNFEIIHHPKSESWAKENINEIVKRLNIKFKISESELELK